MVTTAHTTYAANTQLSYNNQRQENLPEFIVIEDQIIAATDDNQAQDLSIVIEDQIMAVIIEDHIMGHQPDNHESIAISADKQSSEPETATIIEDEILTRTEPSADTAEVIIVDIINRDAPVTERAITAQITSAAQDDDIIEDQLLTDVSEVDGAEFIIIEDQIIMNA